MFYLNKYLLCVSAPRRLKFLDNKSNSQVKIETQDAKDKIQKLLNHLKLEIQGEFLVLLKYVYQKKKNAETQRRREEK